MTGGLSPDDQRLLCNIINVFNPKKVLEIGTHIGSSTVSIALAMHKKNTEYFIKTVDLKDVNDEIKKPWLDFKSNNSPKNNLKFLNVDKFVEFQKSDSLNFLKEETEKYDRKLLLRVGDIMHRGDEMPSVMADQPLQAALLEMTQKGFGMTTVMSPENKLIGIFTDGDLRRIFDLSVDITNTPIGDVMSMSPKTIHQNMLAAEALTIMENSSITALIVEDDHQHPILNY